MRNLKIGEELNIKEEYFTLAEKICECLLEDVPHLKPKMVIAVGGESGSGKSTTGFCLEQELLKRGVKTEILHMDSYFLLPPRDNHRNRLKSFENVGPHELNWKLLNEHLQGFREGLQNVELPIVDYQENRFYKMNVDFSEVQVLIIEGVYSLLVEDLDHSIFMSRTYKDTYANRIARTREKHDPIIEQILEIEHNIVKPMLKKASYIIDKNYKIV